MFVRNVQGSENNKFSFLTISAFREDKEQEVMAVRSICSFIVQQRNTGFLPSQRHVLESGGQGWVDSNNNRVFHNNCNLRNDFRMYVYSVKTRSLQHSASTTCTSVLLGPM
jgi:hypothetical protein